MPISINKAQQQALSDGFLDTSASDTDAKAIRLGITEKVLAQFGAEFALRCAELANERGVTASGFLGRNIISSIVDESTLQIIVPDYFDYPNEGVRGKDSSRNAPNSPYKYKTYGMSREGRASIREYIRSGVEKIANVKRDRAFGIGSERKGKSLLDTKTDTLVYLIKKYGIKTTNYFNDAVKEVFADFEIKMSEAVGADIIFTLKKLNK